MASQGKPPRPLTILMMYQHLLGGEMHNLRVSRVCHTECGGR